VPDASFAGDAVAAGDPAAAGDAAAEGDAGGDGDAVGEDESSSQEMAATAINARAAPTRIVCLARWLVESKLLGQGRNSPIMADLLAQIHPRRSVGAAFAHVNPFATWRNLTFMCSASGDVRHTGLSGQAL
jgi:hypothetical protein